MYIVYQFLKIPLGNERTVSCKVHGSEIFYYRSRRSVPTKESETDSIERLQTEGWEMVTALYEPASKLPSFFFKRSWEE